MSEWPKYQSHKIVQAAKIVAIDRNVASGKVTRLLVDPGTDVWEDFMPTEAGMAERAKVGDWAMLYPDNFKSVSPAKAFEDGYTLCP